jgi:hypothetical protein
VSRAPLLAALAGVLLLVAFPARSEGRGAGALWRIAGHLPAFDGTSLLFWVLVPLSGVVLCVRIRKAPRRWLVLAFALCFLISAVAIRNSWQKYVDPFALLVLLFTIRPGELTPDWKLAGALALIVAFVIYAVDLSSHASAQPPRAGPVHTHHQRRNQPYPQHVANRRLVGEQRV